MSNGVPKFNVRAFRHPVLGRDYDSRTHRYKSSYLNPSKYKLIVDAFPGKKVLIPAGDQALPSSGNPQRKPKDIEILNIPPATVAFDFSIKQVGGPFTKSVSNPTSVTGVFNEDLPNNPWDWQVDVPEVGTYDITVQLRSRTGGGPLATRRVSFKDFLIVSIGDSAASGQGNPDVPGTPKGFEPDFKWWEVFVPPLLLFEIAKAAYTKMKNLFKQKFTTLSRLAGFTLDMDPEPIWLEPKAYRSLRSGHALAARKLDNLSQGHLVTFLSFARTGSEVINGLLGPRLTDGKSDDGFIGNIGQIQEVRNTIGKRRIDALLISIGVNDINVSGTLKNLVAHDIGNDDADVRELEGFRVDKKIKEELPAAFDRLEEALKSLNIRHIYLTEYPTRLFDGKDGNDADGCGIFSSAFDLDISRNDAGFVRKTAEKLNSFLAQQAKDRQWFFITGIAERFRGHGYCTDDKTRFFVQAEESMIFQGDTEGTIHPNDKGHRVYAEQIATAVKRNTLDKPDLQVFLKNKLQVKLKPSGRVKAKLKR